MHDTPAPPFRLGLISMPWSIFNRPSIQLAALKAYLDTRTPRRIATSLFHPYLTAAAAVGSDTYHHLAKNSWAGEALYSPMLFPQQRSSAEKLFRKSCSRDKDLRDLDFQSCSRALEEDLDRWLDSIDFSTFQLMGFSICFNQLLASLTAARRIKKRCPDLPIVFGGSGCVGEIGHSLLHSFPQIDYVISGEGEKALEQLCDLLAAATVPDPLPTGIISRSSDHKTITSCRGTTDINSLPIPDYSPYFQEMRAAFPEQPFVPVLPIEFSRGCWWNRCTFCNLNLQWHGYRWKTASTMLNEVSEQSRRHQCLDFCFTDNALPPKEADIFFNTLAEGRVDYDFFAEVRVITDPDTPKRYRKGGLSTIQVGIESLSSSLLKKMHKGTTAIENIAAMRQSAEAGMILDGNLITDFPGSSSAEIDETLTNLDFVLPYPPLAAASFFLGHGSPVARDPKAYAICAVTRHSNNQLLFPEKILKELTMLIKGYRGDRLLQKKQWRGVKRKIEQWNSFHKERTGRTHPLSYRDGGNFLIIYQEQLNERTLRHRLQGSSRKLYLFCRKIRTMEEIQAAFPAIKEKSLRIFFQDLSSKKLLFEENDHFLALAISS